ncbi:MAG: hypothetical protein CMF62_03115 [Magnetococcales bacterium]|nr:hypothetical protein [Magnetococcales bacterium]
MSHEACYENFEFSIGFKKEGENEQKKTWYEYTFKNKKNGKIFTKWFVDNYDDSDYSNKNYYTDNNDDVSIYYDSDDFF